MIFTIKIIMHLKATLHQLLKEFIGRLKTLKLYELYKTTTWRILRKGGHVVSIGWR